MGDSTKVKALEKLATFHVKLGYPDTWKDYSTLEIKNDSYWANMESANEWSHAEMIAKAGKPVDKDEWLMTDVYKRQARVKACGVLSKT